MKTSLKILSAVVLFCIFVCIFALIYWKFLDDDFHYSTIEYEDSYKALLKNYENVLSDRVKSIIVESDIIPKEQENRQFIGKKTLLPLGIFGVEERMFGEEVSGQLAKQDITNKVIIVQYVSRTKGTLNFSLSDSFTTIVREEIETQNKVPISFTSFTGECVVASSNSWHNKPTVTCELNLLKHLINSDESDLTLKFLEDAFSSPINEALHPQEGIQDGLLPRMLYFSAVTATTLGYGEIVPLTMRARTIVALESVLGLIFMGFLVVWVTSKN